MNENLLIPNKIIKSKRKSISLVIKNNGEFIVRAPLKSNDDEIFKFINQKAKWIISKRLMQFSNNIMPLTFENKEFLPLLGEDFEIVLNDNKRIKIENAQIFVPKENSKEKLILFIKKYAKVYLLNRVKEIASAFNFKYASVTISSAKTCWGSCGGSNKLHFTYKLMLCPKDVVDYIIIHELCHTVIKNHSNKFWTLVERCDNNYKQKEKWLKINRSIVELI